MTSQCATEPRATAAGGIRRRLWPLMLSGLLLFLLPVIPLAADDASDCHNTSGAKGLAACDRAIASGKHSGLDLAKLHTSRGVERKRAGDIDGAIADYSTAIGLNPKDPFGYNNRANAWRDKGDLARAIADYTAALKIDPGYTAAYVNRGRVHERMKNLDAARADYREAIKRPAKYGNGPGGQKIARQRLAALGGS
jgi:tetratricopeptide (TPR) repeat protein